MSRIKLSSYALIIILIVLTVFAGCNTEERVEDVMETKADREQIGFSFDSFVIERWTRDKEVFVSAAAAMGADVNVQNANGDLETQREQIRHFIKKPVDVIVVVATDSDGLSDVVSEAVKKGINVIAYDRMINNADIDLYISFDNEKVGTLMAEALTDITGGSGKCLMLCGPNTDDNVERVETGFKKTVEKSGLSVEGKINAENWRAEAAYEYLEDNSDILPYIDGIMCGNDNLATQTVKYLAENGLAGKIPVVGQDADLEACQRIVEGTQLMTVYKPVEYLAHTAAEAAVSLAKSGGLSQMSSYYKEKGGQCIKINTDDGHSYDCISLEPVAVDAGNMDSVIIDGGFHLREEVYLNVKR